jgi:hypothetical protein
VNDDRLRAFLADTLALWRVEGTVEAGDGRVVAVILTQEGTTVWIERAAEGMPVRWLARTRPAGEAPDSARKPRPRACASVVGLFNALRAALGVERGNALRIAPPPGST